MLEICINNTGILTPINSVLRGPYNYMVKYTASSDVKSLHVGSVNAKGTSKMWSRQRKIKRHKWSWGFLRILRLRQENSDLPGFLNDQRNYETKITTVASKICLAIRSSSHLQRSTQSWRCRYQHFCEFFCTQNMEKNADEIFLWNMIISYYIILYHYPSSLSVSRCKFQMSRWTSASSLLCALALLRGHVSVLQLLLVLEAPLKLQLRARVSNHGWCGTDLSETCRREVLWSSWQWGWRSWWW